MGVVSGQEIRRRIRQNGYDKRRLLITPLLDETQIGPASVDIRLGSSLVVPRKTHVDSQDVTDAVRALQVERRVYERLNLHYHSRFVLHPGQLILGVTFEYLAVPEDLFCTIASRSSWGRLGLVIATASAVQPGFRGCLTLELANLGDSPIALYPGLPVGQLIFHTIESGQVPVETYEQTGRYLCPTEAEMPGFHRGSADRDLVYWGER